jgi:protein-S-isoprenylcysteine O-methyltransferase Ste14
LAHVGFSFLLSGLYSLLATPLVIALICVISWKEENELAKEFGEEYADYRRKVPMLIPGTRSQQAVKAVLAARKHNVSVTAERAL